MGTVLHLYTISFSIMGTIPEDGFLRIAGESVLKSPVIKGVIALLFIFSAAMGIAYGFAQENLKTILMLLME